MQPREVAGVMRQLRGAPITILMTMVMLTQATGNEELCRCTGYDTGTVRKALDDLEFLGLVRRFRRYNGYVLTARARQLPLFQQALPQDPEPEPALDVDEPAEPDACREGEKISVGSSSYTTLLSDRDISPEGQETTTTNNQLTRAREGRDPEKISLDGDAQQAVAELCELGVAKRTRNGKGALDVVEAALAGGWTGDRVLDEVRGWLEYCQSEAGSSIKTPGVLTACRIRELEPAPEQLPLSREEQARSYIEQQYARIVQH